MERTRLRPVLTAIITLTLCLIVCGCHGSGSYDRNAGRQPQSYDWQSVTAKADSVSKAMKESSIKDNVEFWVSSNYEIRQDLDLAPTKVSFTKEDKESNPYTFEGTISLEDSNGQEWVADWSMQVEVDSSGNFKPVASSEFYGEPQLAS